MKVVFFGTPDYVLPVIQKLYKAYGAGKDGLVAVVTQSPKETGRDKFIQRSPIDDWGYKHKIPVIYDLNKIPDADLGVVAAYGKIIPENIIKKFGNGILNIHPSLLPKYRGASPTQAAITLGDNQTGVSIIKMDPQMDHGPIVSQFKEDISPTDTNASLRTRLFERASDVLVDLIPAYLTGKINLKNQDHDQATFTRTLDKESGFIHPDILKAALEGTSHEDIHIPFIKDASLTVNPESVNNLIRALSPWPGAWTYVSLNDRQLRLKIISSHTENGKLILDAVQLEGKNEVSWKQFQEGYSSFSF